MGHPASSLLDADQIGPVDLALLVFDGPVPDDVGDAIVKLVHTGTVRVIDLAVVAADEDTGEDIADHSDELGGSGFLELSDHRLDLITNEDLQVVKEALPAHTTGLVLVWENTWAATIAEAVRSDGGQLAVFERIPHAAVTEAVAQANTEHPSGE